MQLARYGTACPSPLVRSLSLLLLLLLPPQVRNRVTTKFEEDLDRYETWLDTLLRAVGVEDENVNQDVSNC